MRASQTFFDSIFGWFRASGRILPWREKTNTTHMRNVISVRDAVFASYFDSGLFRDPYRVVVSEVMLQQTQVDRVLEKFTQWMEKWPTISDLSKATFSEVLIMWKGLGYNRRAKFLWQLAKEIVEVRDGRWPETERELRALPGIGQYTARALLSFAFGKQVAVVDTNVERILKRTFNFHPEKKHEYVSFADALLPVGLADPWNQALMDFGSLICTARQPKCIYCPIKGMCRANLQSKAEGFADYAQKQNTAGKKERQLKLIKQVKPPRFEETNRFLRGRIIDMLREKEWKEEDLVIYLSNKYTQFNTARIILNIKALSKEKLVMLSGEAIRLE